MRKFKKEKISIIVVTLNTKKNFIKTLKSIQMQIYQNYEIIVVDGNSIDGTIQEIKKRKKIITKFISKEDNGIYHAMNRGIKLSSGKWIIFMNSGDVFFEKSTLKKFSSIKYKKADIYFSDTIVQRPKLKYLINSKNFNKNTYLMPFCHQSSIIKSKLFKKKKFSSLYKIASDFDFFYYCFFKKKKFKKLTFVLSRIKSGGLSDINRQQVFSENIHILKKYQKFRLCFFLYLVKFKQYLIDLIKIFLPELLKNFIYEIKYKNKLKN